MSEAMGVAPVAPPIRITEPGVYDLPSDVYHADPCDTPSLSVGMIGDLLKAPAKCRFNSPRLNPEWEEPEKQEKFSIGSVAHIMFLEPHLFDDKVCVVRAYTKDGKQSDSWATADAKNQAAAARAAGKTPILAKDMETVMAAREAFLANGFIRAAFTGGSFEQSMFWRHPRFGFWCRARPDFIKDGWRHLNDYKATGNADPDEFGRHAYNMGYHRRAAWYLEGAEELIGSRPDHYWFVNQEVKPPYLPAVVELDEESIAVGREENEKAAAIFAKCLASGNWYGYRDYQSQDRDTAFRRRLPNWAFMRNLEGM